MNIEEIIEEKDLIPCDEDILIVIGVDNVQTVLYLTAGTQLAILPHSEKLIKKLDALGIRIEPYGKGE